MIEVVYWMLLALACLFVLAATFRAASAIVEERRNEHREAEQGDHERAEADQGSDLLSSEGAGEGVDPSIEPTIPIEAWSGQVITGMRAYYASIDERGKVYLRGMADAVWRTASLDAECNRGEGTAADHLARGECTCGIYISPDRVMRQFPTKPVQTPMMVYGSMYVVGGYHQAPSQIVYANVIGWGTVVEHDMGWRVEHCEIQELYVDHDVEWAVSGLQKYGVPVMDIVVRTPDQAADLMRELMTA